MAVESGSKQTAETRDKLLANLTPGAKDKVVRDVWRDLQVPNAAAVIRAYHHYHTLE